MTSQILPSLGGQWLRYHPFLVSFLTIQPTIFFTLSNNQLGFLLNTVIALGLSILEIIESFKTGGIAGGREEKREEGEQREKKGKGREEKDREGGVGREDDRAVGEQEAKKTTD